MHHRSSTASAPTNIGMYMFGGVRRDGGTDTMLDDLWWNAQGSGWQLVNPSDSKPPARSGHSLSASGDDCLLLYGGPDDAGSVLSDLWRWCAAEADGSYWTRINATSSPGPLTGHTVIQSGESRLLIFGGSNGQEENNAIWELDTSTLVWS